jgi:hypothetical protein
VTRAERTVEVAEQRRDEVVGLRTEVRDLRDALRETSSKVDGVGSMVDALGRRQTETEVRLATELVEVSRAVIGVRELLRDRLDDRDRVEDHERRLSALERRSA